MNEKELNEFLEYLANNTPPLVTGEDKQQLWYSRGFNEFRERAITFIQGRYDGVEVTK